ncbi:MAG TPA: DNA alkylation repair protein [Bacteroidales bacterium]|nr:DNA alkylation repair protein [Bacteroidales bacterium]
MDISDIYSLLDANRNERGIAHWERMNMPWSSYGIGLTQLKKLARKIGKNHDLALKLWDEKNYEMMTLATIIDEPAKVSRKQVERQAGKLKFWMLAHSYCTNLMPSVPFQQELAEEWLYDKDDVKRRIAYLLIYNIARDKKDLDDAHFEPMIKIIQSRLQQEENFVKDAMNNALIMIGSRSANLNEKALSAARLIGRVVVDYGDNSCQAMDATKHLSSDRVRKKLKI